MIFLLVFEKTVQVFCLAKGELTIMRVVIWMASITVEFVWQLMSLKIVAGRFGKSEMETGTVKLGGKEHFDKEHIGVKEPFPVTKCQFTS